MANNEDLELDVDEKGGGSKLKLIIIIVVVLLLGGGAAAYFLLFAGGEEKSEEQATGEPAKAEAIYVAFRTPFNTNLVDGRKNRMIQVKMTFLVRSDNAKDAIMKHMPYLQSQILALLSRSDAGFLRTQEGKQDFKVKTIELTNKILQEREDVEAAVERVLFTSFVMQ